MVHEFEINGSDHNVRALDRHESLPRWTRRLVAAAVAIAAIAGGYRGYAWCRIAHLEKQATAFHSRHDYRSTMLVCRRLLQLNPNDATACRLMGETALAAARPEAIDWLRRLVALRPTTENRLELAAAAISRSEVKLAESTLQQIPDRQRNSAHFHEIAGALAVAEKQTAGALEHFARAAQINPQDAQAKLNFASVQLALGGAKSTSARDTLEQLTRESATRLAALRALLTDAIARADQRTQRIWATQLQLEPSASFSDQLLCLESAARRGEERDLLAQLQNAALRSPIEAAAIVSWLNRHQRAEAALAWSATLDRKIAAAQPVPLAIAEAFSCTHQWEALRHFVEHAPWPSADALRLTVASHAMRQSAGNERAPMQATNYWNSALKAAQNDSGLLLTMANLCRGWGYAEQAEEAWWMVANGSVQADVALNALQRHYTEQRNTRGLLRVAQRALQLNPEDAVAANNCASLGLLLGNDANAQRLAEKLHREHPTNAAFTATYAFALHTEGKTAEGVQLLATMNDLQLRTPEIAAYYLVLLVQNGEMDRAMSFLPAAQRATLLPEEQQLVAKATHELLERARAEALARS